MARQNYNDGRKEAATAALLAGQLPSEVAREYSIPVGTVKGWKSKLKKDGQPVPTEKKEAVGELLVGYLEQNLKTLKAQSEVFADPEWIRGQDAQELAVLHGVLTDKTVRILEAMGGPGDEELPDGD